MIRILWATVAVVGLLAMHGFAPHGSLSDSASANPSTTAASTTAVSDTASASGHAAHGEPAVADSDESSGHHGGSGLIGLCLSILAGAIIALGTLLLPALRAWLLVPRWFRVATVLPARLRVVRRPPDLFALSVIRC